MGKYGSPSVAFFTVDGFDLKGVQTSFSPDVEAIMEKDHGLGVDWETSKSVGVRQATLEQQGFFDDAANSVHQALNEQQMVSRVVTFGIAGNVAGQPFTGLQGAFGSRYGRVVSRNALHKANATYTVSGQVDEGRILFPYQQIDDDTDTESASVDELTNHRRMPVTIVASSVANPSEITTATPHGLTTGDTVVIAGHAGSSPDINGEQVVTVVDATTFSIPVNVTTGGTGGTMTAVSSQAGGVGYLAVTELVLDGATNLAVKIRDSDDDASFSDLVTFTPRTAIGAQRLAVTGLVNRYLAIDVVWTGGAGAGSLATLAIGFARA